MENNFGTRRKRNIDMSKFDARRESSVHSLDHYFNQGAGEAVFEETFEEVEEGLEEYEIEEVNEDDIEETETSLESNLYEKKEPDNTSMFLIDGKPFVPKVHQKKESFHDTHVRITTYLEKDVHQIIRMLQKQGQIDTITAFLNESVKAHLMNSYHNNDDK